MELFYGGGGRSNPDFQYKVRVKRPCEGAFEWCDAYPVRGSGYFQRFYVDYREYDQGYITFQFEWEEPYLTFILKYGNC